jgi:hypothetical protein
MMLYLKEFSMASMKHYSNNNKKQSKKEYKKS